MSIDLKKILLEHSLWKLSTVDPPDDVRADFRLARQVTEAVLNESIKISEDWYVGNISDNVPTAEYLRDLKREICGKEKKS